VVRHRTEERAERDTSWSDSRKAWGELFDAVAIASSIVLGILLGLLGLWITAVYLYDWIAGI
jgi:hypothetical protein